MPSKKGLRKKKPLSYVVKSKKHLFFQEISEQRLPFGTARPISRSVHQTTSVLRCAALISDTVAACVGAFCQKPSSRRIVIIIIISPLEMQKPASWMDFSRRLSGLLLCRDELLGHYVPRVSTHLTLQQVFTQIFSGGYMEGHIPWFKVKSWVYSLCDRVNLLDNQNNSTYRNECLKCSQQKWVHPQVKMLIICLGR